MRNKTINIINRNISAYAGRFWGRMPVPYKYTFISTWMCNSRCRICEVWKIYRENPSKFKEELSKEEVIKTFTNCGKDLVWFNVTGGEPLLRDGVDDIVCSVYDKCRNFSMLNIPTNGISTDRTVSVFKNITSYCKGLSSFVSLSVDGIGKKQDELRGVDGCFEKVMKTYECLKNLNAPDLKVLLQITVSKNNADDVWELIDFVKKKKIPFFVNIAHEMRIFHNKGLDVDIRRDEEAAMGLLRKLESEFGCFTLQTLFPKTFLRLSRLFLSEKISPVGCMAMRSTVTVDPYGRVYPCPFLDMPLGSLRESGYDILRVLKSEKAVEKFSGVKLCRDCWQSCEAYPAILQDLPGTLKSFFKAGKL